MRHRAIPLRRLLAEQPEPEPTPEDEANFYAWSRQVEPDPQGDEAWRDAVAEHASMQVRFRR
jgi:hypothetical protein